MNKSVPTTHHKSYGDILLAGSSRSDKPVGGNSLHMNRGTGEDKYLQGCKDRTLAAKMKFPAETGRELKDQESA
jgi:hypothetical protein